MPIRFRCAYCNQLLGIARRKAGAVVRCPTCSGQVIVPSVDAPAANLPALEVDPPLVSPSDMDNFLVDPSDSEELARPIKAVANPDAPAAEPAGAWGTHADRTFDMEHLDVAQAPLIPAEQTDRTAGIVLSPMRATLLTVAVILAVALAFASGLVVGKFLL